MSGQDFSDDQRRYLEGFVSGVQAGRVAQGLKPLGGIGAGPGEPSGPDAPHHKAMARLEADGKKLVNEEKAKRDEHPFDAYARFKAESANGQFPKGVDNFRWRFHGLFYVAPTQDSYMCRLRVANGVMSAWQFAGVADIAERFGGGYAHVTTRANLQIREIGAENGVAVIESLVDLGLTAKGSGADNIRNVTGAPTAGIDPQELLDTRPHARDWHHHILNDRTLYGLPRKFNVAFDGGGIIPVLEETNDIAFTAVTATEGAEPGVWFRLGLGGITGHRDFARSTGVYVKPAEAVAVADAIVRVYIDHGDRTNRQKARLKYLLDDWGFDKFLVEVENKLGRTLVRLPDGAVLAPPRQNRQAHVGVWPQKQTGLVWVGVVLPVGKMICAQMRGLARIAQDLGDGDIRLTVWQNLLISGVQAGDAPLVETRLQALGLTAKATSVRAGLVACTGSTGCKFAAADTKGTAIAIADWVEPRASLDTPVNIHLTGCHHSCAQHYVGDIGLLAAKVDRGEEKVEGYHVYIGGGAASTGEQAMARDFAQSVAFDDLPALLERLLGAYLAHRRAATESFFEFCRRHEVAQLRKLADEAPVRALAA